MDVDAQGSGNVLEQGRVRATRAPWLALALMADAHSGMSRKFIGSSFARTLSPLCPCAPVLPLPEPLLGGLSSASSGHPRAILQVLQRDGRAGV
jgi:hypothetical protein